MIIDLQAPNLPKNEADVMKLNVPGPIAATRYLQYPKLCRLGIAPPVKGLFGHVKSESYAPPSDFKWRKDDSDSDNEDVRMSEEGVEEESSESVAKQPEQPIQAPTAQNVEAEMFDMDTLLSTEELVGEFASPNKGKAVAVEQTQKTIQQTAGSDTESEHDEFFVAARENLEIFKKKEAERQGLGSFAGVGSGQPEQPTQTKPEPKHKRIKSKAKRSPERLKKKKSDRARIVIGKPTQPKTTTQPQTSQPTTTQPQTTSIPIITSPTRPIPTTSFISSPTSAFTQVQTVSSIDESRRLLIEKFNTSSTQQQTQTSQQPEPQIRTTSVDSMYSALQAQMNSMLTMMQAQAAENLKHRQVVDERERKMLMLLDESRKRQERLETEVLELRSTNAEYAARLEANEVKMIEQAIENKSLRDYIDKRLGEIPRIEGAEHDESESDEDDDDNDDEGDDVPLKHKRKDDDEGDDSGAEVGGSSGTTSASKSKKSKKTSGDEPESGASTQGEPQKHAAKT